MDTPRRLATALVVVLLAAACSPDPGADVPTDPTSAADFAPPQDVATDPAAHLRPSADGVATVADRPGGAASLADTPLRVAVGDVPRWIAGVTLEDGVGLVVVTEADGVHALRLDDDGPARVRPPVDRTDWHRPPVLVAADGDLRLVAPPADASPAAPVLPLDGGDLAYVAADGALVIADAAGERRLPLDLLPDTWLVPVDGTRVVAALAAPTDEYGHGVLGDAIEAREVLVVDLDRGEVLTRIPVDGVVEGVRPVVGRLPGHDGDLLVVTVSDAEGGADVVAYTPAGDLVATTGAIGTGNRWRHVIAVDPAAGLVEVVTPHLGKELRTGGRVVGARIEAAVALPGVMSSHAIGSRDLDEAGLVEVDGRLAVIGPGPARRTLVAVAVDDGSVLVEHTLPSPWASNLATVGTPDGTSVAVGLEDGSVLVWPASR